MADKSILQLLAASVLNLSDTGVIVQGTETEKFQLQLLIDLLTANVDLGSNVTFGTTTPTGGKPGDLYIKTTTNQFFQNISGTWTVIYTVVPTTGTTFIYATGVPGSGTGNNGDSYINTLTGVFYQKSSGSWVQKFSMATGPQGPQGTPGAAGVAGVNGNTVLYGNHNPSNLSDGVNGDFYINTANFTLFGPKASSVWPAGTSLIGPQGDSGSAITLNQDETFLLEDGTGTGNWYLPFLDDSGAAIEAGGVFACAIISTGVGIGPENFDPTFSPPRIYGFTDNTAKTITVAVLFGSGMSPVTPGHGVPAGGSTGQVLAKVNGTDYNTAWVTGTGGGLASSNFVFNATFTGSINSSNTAYTMPDTPVTGTVRVYQNGLRINPSDYSVTVSVVTFVTAPTTGDSLAFDYIK